MDVCIAPCVAAGHRAAGAGKAGPAAPGVARALSLHSAELCQQKPLKNYESQRQVRPESLAGQQHQRRPQGPPAGAGRSQSILESLLLRRP